MTGDGEVTGVGEMPGPVVTALRARNSDRVAVELDGRPWRVVQLAAIHAAGLAVGNELDRTSARRLGREIRRLEAQGAALRALRARDHTAASLGRRLAQRGTPPALLQATVEAVERAGLVDDERFAMGRAALLAGRGSGDLLIADDLERQGVPAELALRALQGLEPERLRAQEIIEARGLSGKTARYLAAKGFSEAALEPIVADLGSEQVG
jgi:regulatory protein